MIQADKLRLVSGFLTPAMVGSDPRGRTLNAFSNHEDVDRISKGYACGNCCATFHSFQLECPLCGEPTNVSAQVQDAPADWQAHVDQRHVPIPTHGPGAREPLPGQASATRTPDEFLAALAADRDVDQVALSRLKPSKRGRR